MNSTATATETHTVTAINRGLGTVEIHKQGCRDLKRNARGASVWDIEAKSQQDVAEDVFEDMIAEDPEYTWEAYNVELSYANCCPALPYMIEDEAEVAAPAQAKARTDLTSLIMTYLEGHRGVIYTPHTLGKAIGHTGLRDAMARLADQGKIYRTSTSPARYVLRVQGHSRKG